MEACQSSLGKEEIGWEVDPFIRSHQKLGKLIGYFENVPDPSQAWDDKIPGNKEELSLTP